MKDELDILEERGRTEREKRKAARKTPEAKTKRNRGRAQRNRGLRLERKVAKLLEEFGARRVPLSGAAGGSRKDDPWAGDVKLEHPLIKTLEVKRREGALKQVRNWLLQGNADALVVDTGGGQEMLVIMGFEKFTQLLWLQSDKGA